MAILNSVAGGLVKGTLIVGGASLRIGVKACYSLGEAGAHGLRVGEVEYDKQVVLTNECIAVAKANAAESAKRFAAMKAERELALAQAAPVMTAVATPVPVPAPARKRKTAAA